MNILSDKQTKEYNLHGAFLNVVVDATFYRRRSGLQAFADHMSITSRHASCDGLEIYYGGLSQSPLSFKRFSAHNLQKSSSLPPRFDQSKIKEICQKLHIGKPANN